MPQEIELSDGLVERLESHLEEDQSVEEFVEELLNIYEQEEFFSDSGL